MAGHIPVAILSGLSGIGVEMVLIALITGCCSPTPANPARVATV
jgi:hypothetical protein